MKRSGSVSGVKPQSAYTWCASEVASTNRRSPARSGCAFASTYEREAAYTEEQWRGWFHDRFALFFAYVTGTAEPAGLAGVHDTLYLWVAEANKPHAGCTSAAGSPRPVSASRCR